MEDCVIATQNSSDYIFTLEGIRNNFIIQTNWVSPGQISNGLSYSNIVNMVGRFHQVVFHLNFLVQPTKQL